MENGEMRICALKAITSIVLLAMLYMVVGCPCKRLLCCHLGWFYGMMAALLTVTVAENGLRTGCA